MKNRYRLGIIVVFLLLVGWLASLFVYPPVTSSEFWEALMQLVRSDGSGAEPTYQGRSLTQWLDIYYNGYPDRPPDDRRFSTREERRTAENAIRRIGTNAIPLAMRWISEGHQRSSGSEVLDILGKDARPAVSSLIKLLNDAKRKEIRFCAFQCLLRVEPDSEVLVPVLTRLVEDPDKTLSYYAAEQLAILDYEAAKAAGVLEHYPRLSVNDDESPTLPELELPSSGTTTGKHTLTLNDVTHSTEEYRKEAIRLLVKEANWVARELNLPEQLGASAK